MESAHGTTAPKRQYITATTEFCKTDRYINAPIFKRVFDAEKGTFAQLTVSVVGLYRCWLNGKEITKGLLAPYIYNPDHIAYYDEYDITDLLAEKDNVLCVLLGNGFSNAQDNGLWAFESAPFRAAPKFYLSIAVDGEEILTTDADFLVKDSPILFDDIRCGERYDARLEDESLHLPVYAESFRAPLFAEAPKGEYRKCEAEPVRVHEELCPVAIIENDEGFIYDFGKITAGIFQLKFGGVRGQQIDLYFAEMVSKNKLDMSAIVFSFPPYAVSPEDHVQHDRYICKGGYEEYTPSFTYHGFRYCLVKGITREQATASLLTAKGISSHMRQRATFSCSNETVNQIQACALNSALTNFVHVITDCPQREKNGWTSEAHVSSEYILYNYGAERALREWMLHIRKAQKENGQIPGIIPTGGWGYDWNGTQWDKILVEIPRLLYLFTGDREIIRENAECIKKYILYMRSRTNENGLLSYGLPDWCVIGSLGDGDDKSTPVEVSATLVGIDILRIARNLLREIQDTDFLSFIDETEEALLFGFKERYVDGCRITCDSQTAQALAIALQIFEEKDRNAAVEHLVALVHRDNGTLHSGVLGYRYVLNVLAENGYADLAYSMIMRSEHPGYANLIKQGATSLWEKFTEYYETDAGMRQKDGQERNYSLNHSAFGGVSAWFYNHLAGIKILRHDTVSVEPKLPAELEEVNAYFSNQGAEIYVTVKNGTVRIDNRGFNCTFIHGGKTTVCGQGVCTFSLTEE